LPPLEQVIPLFLILLFSLSVHEAAHAWTADRLGDPTARRLGRITLNPLAHIDWIGTVLFPLIALISHVPLLGWAKPVPVDPRNFRAPRRDFGLVAVAGPVSNLILAVIGAIVFRVLYVSFENGGSATLQQTAAWFAQGALLNITLAVFNLIPVPPLDGGNVAMGLLPVTAAQAVAQLRPYGFLILYALMLTGVLGRVIFPIASAIANLLLPAVL
jgi:Zn-dependent protease